ncbi:MAG: FkbM family methyltransferase [Desulfobulbus sp.]|jgi:FkbM family methyltransferase|nr:MAG: FkbM family methyltransferase [Desulfobulbus sp.]
MLNLNKILIAAINRAGRVIPKKMQRRIADFPGVIKFFEKMSGNQLVEITTPEGWGLVVNPLFHSNLLHEGDLLGYEPKTREIISKFAKPGMVAYDIGANVGIFTFLFASIVGDQGAVYSFEPEENNYTCLQKSLDQLNKKNIVLDKRAVGKTKSREKFDRRGGAYSGRLIGDGAYSTTDNLKIVETVSLDYAVKQEGYRMPDILKIDVEGNEIMVLEGMKMILDSHNPLIICEIHTHLGESAKQVIGLLTSHGYSISPVNDALASNSLDAREFNINKGGHIIAFKTK